MVETKEMAGLIRKAIEEFISEKEEQAKLDKAEELFKTAQATIEELTDAVNSKTAELASLTGEKEEMAVKADELAAVIEDLNAKLEEASTALTEMTERATKAEDALASIVKDRLLETRMRELEEAKVCRQGDKLEAQKEKVRDMDSEEFAAYKEHLVELRSEIESALTEAANTEETDEEVIDVAPPQIDPKAQGAGINVEVAARNDLASKYHALGLELAAKLKREDKE